MKRFQCTFLLMVDRSKFCNGDGHLKFLLGAYSGVDLTRLVKGSFEVLTTPPPLEHVL